MRLRLRFGLLLVCLLVVTLMLAACGDPTATPVPATTAFPTTVAATKAATTSAVTTSVAGTLALPPFAGLKEIELDSSFKAAIGKQIPQLQNFDVKGYVSDDSDENVAASLDTALTGAGYKYALPGATKITRQGDSYFGLYAKAGAPELLIAVQQVPTDPAKLVGSPTQGLSQEVTQKFIDQVKGKKTFAAIIGSNDLLKAMANGRANSTETAAATTTAAISAVATPEKESTVAATPSVTGQGGPGSELVGTLIATRDADVRVTKVERFTELKNGSKTITPQKGVFMAVSYEIANVGKEPVIIALLVLKDGQGNEIKSVHDYEATDLLSSAYGYKSDININPGFVGNDFRLYDVPKEVSGFKLEADELIASKSRQASPDSFTNSGGKGPDSGAGQELVGKTFTNPTYNLAVKITKVERLTEIKSGSKTLKPRGNGVYLVVVYQATNNGDKELNSTAFKLKDNLGRIFVGGGYEASIAMSDKYPSISSLGPGKTGNDFRVFEVVRDAKGFEPTDTDF